MRIYAASDEENLRTLRLLKDWSAEGFLSEAQHLRMKQDVECTLRRTNGFLRAVFFLFTVSSAGAAVGLFFAAMPFKADSEGAGLFLLIFALVCYRSAEAAVSSKQFYRHGVEEGLVVLSIMLLGVGLVLAFFDHVGRSFTQSIVPGSAAVASSLVYRRFGYQYAFAAAMVLAAAMPQFWTSSHALRHVIVAGVYAAGLAVTIRVRRKHRFGFRDDEYSVTEALLWAGLYLAVNLRLSSLDLLRKWWIPVLDFASFPKAFYWATYALVWCLPVAILWRALTRKDRAATAAGLAAAILTLATNKPYLGLLHRTWDPMLLGVLLIGTAAGIKRWLAKGEDGVRTGFTARRLAASDEKFRHLVSTVGVAVSGSPVVTPAPQNTPLFGGGDSGGGGATSDF